MSPMLPFIIFAVAFVALIVVVVLMSRASAAARMNELAQMGFTPCPAEQEQVTRTLTELENNREYRYTVSAPMKAALSGQDLFYYRKERHRSGSIEVVEEFLLPLERPSADGLMFFVKPSDLAAGTATTLIGAVATGAWDSQPDDLTQLEIPAELRESNLIGALGPSGAALYDLIDATTLSLLLRAGDCGALVVTCRGGWCSLSNTTTRMPVDLEKMHALLRDLIP